MFYFYTFRCDMKFLRCGINKTHLPLQLLPLQSLWITSFQYINFGNFTVCLISFHSQQEAGFSQQATWNVHKVCRSRYSAQWNVTLSKWRVNGGKTEAIFGSIALKWMMMMLLCMEIISILLSILNSKYHLVIIVGLPHHITVLERNVSMFPDSAGLESWNGGHFRFLSAVLQTFL